MSEDGENYVPYEGDHEEDADYPPWNMEDDLEQMSTAVTRIFESLYGKEEDCIVDLDSALSLLRLAGQGGEFEEEYLNTDGQGITKQSIIACVTTYGDTTDEAVAVARSNASKLRSIASLRALASDGPLQSKGPLKIALGNPANMTQRLELVFDSNVSTASSSDVEFNMQVRVTDKHSLHFLQQFCAPLSTLVNYYLNNEFLVTRTKVDLVDLGDKKAVFKFQVDFAETTVMSEAQTSALEHLSTNVKNVHAYVKFAPLREMTGIDNVALELGLPIDLYDGAAEFAAGSPDMISSMVLNSNDQLEVPEEGEEPSGLGSMLFQNIEDVYRAIPGLKAFSEGDLQAKIDLTGLIAKVKTVGSSMNVDVTDFKGALSGLAPIGLMLLPEKVQLDPNQAIEAGLAVLQMQKLLAARDVKEILEVQLNSKVGLTGSIQFNGLLNVEAIFQSLEDGMRFVHDVINTVPADQDFPTEEDF